jgi:hypothetical protein
MPASSILPALLTNALEPLQLGSVKPASMTATKTRRDLAEERVEKGMVFMTK